MRLTLSIYDRSSVWGLAPKCRRSGHSAFPLKIKEKRRSRRTAGEGRSAVARPYPFLSLSKASVRYPNLWHFPPNKFVVA